MEDILHSAHSAVMLLSLIRLLSLIISITVVVGIAFIIVASGRPVKSANRDKLHIVSRRSGWTVRTSGHHQFWNAPTNRDWPSKLQLVAPASSNGREVPLGVFTSV